jgi:thymidylate synthase
MIQSDSFQEIYSLILKESIENSQLWGKCKIQKEPITFKLLNPLRSLINHKKNWAWAFHEIINRLSFEEPTLMNPGTAHFFRPNWKRKLLKEGGTFHYSYGQSYAKQIPHVIKALRNSAGREAILSMWEPNYLININKYDRRPCTFNLHFMRPNKVLDCHVYMRTVDIMNMLPYDVFHHTFIQRYLASVLDIELGNFYFTASFGYYQKKRDISHSVVNTYNKLKEKPELEIESDWIFNDHSRIESMNMIARLDSIPPHSANLSLRNSAFGINFINALESTIYEDKKYPDDFLKELRVINL